MQMYIKKYSKKNDKVLDPFVGSGMTYFESIRLNRIPITIDLNPITDFSIKCLSLSIFNALLLALNSTGKVTN